MQLRIDKASDREIAWAESTFKTNYSNALMIGVRDSDLAAVEPLIKPLRSIDSHQAAAMSREELMTQRDLEAVKIKQHYEAIRAQMKKEDDEKMKAHKSPRGNISPTTSDEGQSSSSSSSVSPPVLCVKSDPSRRRVSSSTATVIEVGSRPSSRPHSRQPSRDESPIVLSEIEGTEGGMSTNNVRKHSNTSRAPLPPITGTSAHVAQHKPSLPTKPVLRYPTLDDPLAEAAQRDHQQRTSQLQRQDAQARLEREKREQEELDRRLRELELKQQQQPHYLEGQPNPTHFAYSPERAQGNSRGNDLAFHYSAANNSLAPPQKSSNPKTNGSSSQGAKSNSHRGGSHHRRKSSSKGDSSQRHGGPSSRRSTLATSHSSSGSSSLSGVVAPDDSSATPPPPGGPSGKTHTNHADKMKKQLNERKEIKEKVTSTKTANQPSASQSKSHPSQPAQRTNQPPPPEDVKACCAIM